MELEVCAVGPLRHIPEVLNVQTLVSNVNLELATETGSALTSTKDLMQVLSKPIPQIFYA